MKLSSTYEVHSDLIDMYNLDLDLYWVKKQCYKAMQKLKLLMIDRTITVATVENFCIKLDAVYFRVNSVIRIDQTVLANVNVDLQDIYFPPQDVFVFPEESTVVDVKLLEGNKIPEIKGPYMDYEWDCPYVRFNEDNAYVAIEAMKVRSDDKGFPLIPEVALNACVAWCAYVYYRPMFMQGKIGVAQYQAIEEWKNREFGQARGDSYTQQLSRNDIDEIFDVVSSMDRKHYNVNM